MKQQRNFNLGTLLLMFLGMFDYDSLEIIMAYINQN